MIALAILAIVAACLGWAFIYGVVLLYLLRQDSSRRTASSS